ncbi:hypothetical protein [Treponema zioleckii]|uniref:hypothetical protein n=1 Tax=Treponema zioleckii TaxID=331680 RepID=UPI00168BC54B|nr:hypothetical protein [Treponema zioleckii]
MKRKLIFISAIFFLVISRTMASPADGGDVTFSPEWQDHSEVYLIWGTMSVIPPLVGLFGAIGGALSGADDVSGGMSGVIGFGADTYLFDWLFVGFGGTFEHFSMSYDDKEAYSINFWTAQAPCGLAVAHQKTLYLSLSKRRRWIFCRRKESKFF